MNICANLNICASISPPSQSRKTLAVIAKKRKNSIIKKINKIYKMSEEVKNTREARKIAPISSTQSETPQEKAWLSENFSNNTKTQEPEIVPAVSVLDEIRATINLNQKQTKKELLAQLSSIEFLLNK